MAITNTARVDNWYVVIIGTLRYKNSFSASADAHTQSEYYTPSCAHTYMPSVNYTSLSNCTSSSA